jgi:hypothetical protein
MSGFDPLKRLMFARQIQGGKIMSEFLYLYRGADRGASPEQMQQRMQKWMAWMKELGAKGHIKDQGQPLERAGKLVKGKQKTVTDGPFAEAKDVVGGYTLVVARDLDHAALGEFEFRRGSHRTARQHFRKALALARNPMERHFLEHRMAACEC